MLILATKSHVVAGLDADNGVIRWRHVFESDDIAQWESVLVMRSQIFEHFSKYFTIWEITFLLITQSNLNGFKFR